MTWATSTIMTLAIGQKAADFEADTTQSRIRFQDRLGASRGVLFSHPRDDTPVCATERGDGARLVPAFTRRDVKVIGLSVDPVASPAGWEAKKPHLRYVAVA